MNEIREHLLALFEASGWTQARLVKLSGVHQATISSWMRGTRPNPGIENLVRIAWALDVSPAEFGKMLYKMEGKA